LVELQTCKLTDPRHLDLLGAAHSKVRTARETIDAEDPSEVGQGFVRTLRGLEAALDAGRQATIEAVVGVQQQLLRGAPPSQSGAKARGPLRASCGEAQLHAYEREPLQTSIDVSALERLAELEAPEELFASADETSDGPIALADELGPTADKHLPIVGQERASVSEPAEPPMSEEPQLDSSGLDGDEPEHDEPDPVKRIALLGGHGGGQPATAVAGIEGELAQARRVARDCMEEIGALGNLRRLEEHELWGSATAGFEQRLLNALDALLSLGRPFYLLSGKQARCGGLDVLEELLRYARDAFAADPVRTFARAFVLGCVQGKDTVRAAVLALEQSHVLTHTAQAQAFALAASPEIDEAMRRLCRGDDARLLGVALDVMWARGSVDYAATVALLQHPDEEVRARAARCLGRVTERRSAVRLLEAVVDAEQEDVVLVAAAEALVRQGSPAGLQLARDRLQEDLSDPGLLMESARLQLLHLLAVVGAVDDGRLLLRCYGGRPAEAEALGWHGNVAHVETLLSALDPSLRSAHGGSDLREAAARALWRVTGASLREDGRVSTAPADRYQKVVALEPWRQWWQENQERFAVSEAAPQVMRWRFGAPYEPLASLDELAADEVPMGVRRRCGLELAVALVGVTDVAARHIDIDSWVVRQQRQMLALRAAISRAEEGDSPLFSRGRWVGDHIRAVWAASATASGPAEQAER